MANIIEPPPRLEGNPTQDIAAIAYWLENSLYAKLALEVAFLQTSAQPAPLVNPQTGGVEAYPVGSIFITVLPADAATQLGYGTWERFGKGRALIGVDEDDTDFDTVEETSGAKTVTPSGSVSAPTFTGDPLGTHTHTTTTAGATTGTDFDAVTALDPASAGTPSGTISAPTFTGVASSVLQPGISVFFWKRTA